MAAGAAPVALVHVGKVWKAELSMMSAGSDGPWLTFMHGMDGRGAAPTGIVVGHRWVGLDGLGHPGAKSMACSGVGRPVERR